MEFEEAVATAPPGWTHFTIEDVSRLPATVRAHELGRVPAGETDDRILRGLFWTLVYHLEPERWDELARHEPIHLGLIGLLPRDVRQAVDVGAGSGRLTAHLARRSRRTVAVEPSRGLRRLLHGRLPDVRLIAGWADRLPLRSGFSELTAACGAVGPDPEILAELRRVTATGGTIALISPEHPEWFEAHGWERTTLPPPPAPAHPAWLEEFFGPLDPPHEMVTMRAG
jgi:SAM-dependent methyltransferase